MDAIFMNLKNYKTFHRKLINFSDKINLQRNDKYNALSNCRIYKAWRNKNPNKTIN